MSQTVNPNESSSKPSRLEKLANVNVEFLSQLAMWLILAKDSTKAMYIDDARYRNLQESKKIRSFVEEVKNNLDAPKHGQTFIKTELIKYNQKHYFSQDMFDSAADSIKEQSSRHEWNIVSSVTGLVEVIAHFQNGVSERAAAEIVGNDPDLQRDPATLRNMFGVKRENIVYDPETNFYEIKLAYLSQDLYQNPLQRTLRVLIDVLREFSISEEGKERLLAEVESLYFGNNGFTHDGENYSPELILDINNHLKIKLQKSNDLGCYDVSVLVGSNEEMNALRLEHQKTLILNILQDKEALRQRINEQNPEAIDGKKGSVVMIPVPGINFVDLLKILKENERQLGYPKTDIDVDCAMLMDKANGFSVTPVDGKSGTVSFWVNETTESLRKRAVELGERDAKNKLLEFMINIDSIQSKIVENDPRASKEGELEITKTIDGISSEQAVNFLIDKQPELTQASYLSFTFNPSKKAYEFLNKNGFLLNILKGGIYGTTLVISENSQLRQKRKEAVDTAVTREKNVLRANILQQLETSSSENPFRYIISGVEAAVYLGGLKYLSDEERSAERIKLYEELGIQKAFENSKKLPRPSTYKGIPVNLLTAELDNGKTAVFATSYVVDGKTQLPRENHVWMWLGKPETTEQVGETRAQ